MNILAEAADRFADLIDALAGTEETPDTAIARGRPDGGSHVPRPETGHDFAAIERFATDIKHREPEGTPIHNFATEIETAAFHGQVEYTAQLGGFDETPDVEVAK